MFEQTRIRVLRWLLGTATLAEQVCADRAEFLIEPTQPHPGGAHICTEPADHLRLGVAHRCRNCPVEWWPL